MSERQATAEGSPQGALVRVVAVGNRVSVAARSEDGFVAELERIVGLAAPHLTPDRPNLLVLSEVLGLPAALAGPRGILARHPPGPGAALGLLAGAVLLRRSPWLSLALAALGLGSAALAIYPRRSRVAVALLALPLAPRMLRYMRLWPGISPTRALFLASADALYRPFVETLARLAATHRTHIVAGTVAPNVRRATDRREIRAWGRPGSDHVYRPEDPRVYNTALVFGPDGALLGRVNKVSLTESDRRELDITPGRLDEVRVIPTAAGRLGVAISLDAFTPAYVRSLDVQDAEIVVQLDANDQLWAAPTTQTRRWQPQDWLGSVLGSIQPEYPHLRYNVCAMQTGNLFDVTFDGQSSITAKPGALGPDRGTVAPGCGHTFVGVDEHTHAETGQSLLGDFVAVAPWVVDDPGGIDPALTLAERRARLRRVARELLPGGTRANGYRESVIWADLPIRTARDD
jgi:predicted amidohydrolase